MIEGVPLVIRHDKEGRIVIKWLPWTTVDMPDKVAQMLIKSLQEVLEGKAYEVTLFVHPEIEEDENEEEKGKQDKSSS